MDKKESIVGYSCILVALLLIVWYVIQGYVFYSEYLSSDLTYIPPALEVAPEDILGLGFFIYWVLYALTLIILLSVSIFSLQNRKIVIYIFLIFTIASLCDYYLYGILEENILQND